MSSNILRRTGRLAAAITLALAGTAYADDAVRPKDTLEEVVVTAQKRAERLIDVPMSVAAVTGAEIEARGVSSLMDMQYSVPGLTMSEFGPGQGRLQLDGISTAGGSTGLPTVGRYLDEMPITADGAGAELDLRLYDMERVEVLHGPQPTLYGEGSMGGTIHFVTASPDLKNFAGHVEGTWGEVANSADSYGGYAMLNVPLIPDVLGVRLVAGYQDEGGWIDSRTTGQNNINETQIDTWRIKVLYQPTQALSVSLMVLGQSHDQANQNYAALDRTTSALTPQPNLEHYGLGNLVINYDLGFATLLSSTGYLNRKPEIAFDQSGYFVPLLGDPAITTAQELTWGFENMFSQELRLASKSEGPFNYVVGAYYRDYRTEGLIHFATAPGSLPFPLYDDDSLSQSESWAVFGEVRYKFTDRFEALLGLRHFDDKRTYDDSANIFGQPSVVNASATFSSNNPRLNLSYKISPDGIVYANVAKGFRSGGFNAAAVGAQPPTYAPETLWTYEVGAKHEWFEHRFSVDISVYYNNWKDIQQVGIVAGNPNGYVDNSGKASGPGVNMTLQARPILDLTLTGTLGYADMKYDTNSANTNSGDPLDMVSKLTYSLAADYRHALTAATQWFARADWQYSDGYQLTLRNTPFTAINATGSREVLDLRIGAAFNRIETYVFATNATDRNGILYPTVGTLPEPVLATPRTVGLGFKADF